jgi:Uma2 family endonuclease
MGTSVKDKGFTFDDFCVVVNDKKKADLIEGKIFMASPDNTEANKLAGWLYALMLCYVQLKRCGEVFHSRVSYRLDTKNGPEPDVSFVKQERLGLVDWGFVNGPPDLAIEVVSPESRERDYHDKRRQYEQHGVEEYWIVDEVEEKVTFLRLNNRGKYREIKVKQGVFRSEVLQGFWIQTKWFWERPLPVITEILDQLLPR